MSTADLDEEAALGEVLLQLARDAIAARLNDRGRAAPPATPPVEALDAPGACFVTLKLDGHLRGCIGSLDAFRPLRLDVVENAVAAAFRDPRFPPLAANELPRVRVEVSLLTPPEPLPVASEDELRRCLRPGRDGIVFRVGDRRATFLPQVWDELPTPDLFLARLKEKAGLRADYWSDEVRIERYGVCKWKES